MSALGQIRNQLRWRGFSTKETRIKKDDFPFIVMNVAFNSFISYIDDDFLDDLSHIEDSKEPHYVKYARELNIPVKYFNGDRPDVEIDVNELCSQGFIVVFREPDSVQICCNFFSDYHSESCPDCRQYATDYLYFSVSVEYALYAHMKGKTDDIDFLVETGRKLSEFRKKRKQENSSED